MLDTTKFLKYLTNDQIELIAKRLREKMGVLENALIDVTEMSEELGYPVYEVEFEEEDVVGIVEDGENSSINVSNRMTERGKRFMIAHLLAHIVLGHVESSDENNSYVLVDYKLPLKDSDKARDTRKETQADILAAAILMPYELVSDIWEKSKSIDVVSDYFRTTKKCTIIRLDNMGKI